MSARPPTWNNLAATGRIFMKFDVCVFLENLLRKFKLHRNVARIAGTLHEDIYMIISRSFLLRSNSVSEKICRENKSAHFTFNDPPPPPKIMLFEVMWKKML
jgi:hypothetical protein